MEKKKTPAKKMVFKKYFPTIQARTSSLDTFLTCPLKSTLPFDMDVFTSYIGKLLHYSHQSPDLCGGMVDLFMVDYKDIVGERDNELRDMLYRYIEKGREFLKESEGKTIYYEAPIETEIDGVWIAGHPDIIILNEDSVEIIDFKSSQNPGSYSGVLEISSLETITKAQPYIYCYLSCLITGKEKAKFTYYVYSKAKSTKLHKHSVDFEFDELEKIVKYIIDKYKTSCQLGIREPKDNDLCWSCPIGPKHKGTCPIRIR